MGKVSELALLELNNHDWGSLQAIVGPADYVPAAMEGLLACTHPDDIEQYYWKIENHVVVQGQLFESATALVSVLLAALVDSPYRHVRITVLDLLFQIVNGGSHQAEVERGLPNLGDICREEAKKGLWLLYREVLNGESDAALEILEIIDRSGRIANYIGKPERSDC